MRTARGGGAGGECARMRRLDSPRARAAAMVFSAAALWGLSGTVAQSLMQGAGVGAAWLVCLRMLVAGGALALLAAVRLGGHALAAPWRTRAEAAHLVAFSLLGLFAVQFTYLAAIRASNAAAATFLQYVGSALVVVWGAARARRAPTLRQAAAVAAALAGIALLATDGSPTDLAVPLPGLLWGLAAAVSLAVNTILPAPLVRRHGALAVLAWGMLLGGGAGALLLRPAPWPPAAAHTEVLAEAGFVAILGTLVPFTLYMASMGALTAAETALFANAEPVAAAVAAALWLHVRLGPWAMGGGALVLAATTDLYRRPPPAAPETAATPAAAAGRRRNGA